jgi:hypothetical protein
MEWSLLGLTVLVIVWIICSAVFLDLWWLWAIVSGLAVEIILGAYIGYLWGKSYLQRSEGL